MEMGSATREPKGQIPHGTKLNQTAELLFSLCSSLCPQDATSAGSLCHIVFAFTALPTCLEAHSQSQNPSVLTTG